MNKCWIHGPTEDNKEKPSKPLKEHPGHPDTIKDNFQQNLEMILQPSQKTYAQKEKELTEDFKQKNIQREREKENYKKELEQEISQWEINFQHLQQVKDNEIAAKDDRIAQLDKLFQGTAKIFSKQHNYVDQLKKQLEEESKAKGISEEKAEHLQADIEQLDQQKTELEQRIKELEKEEAKSKAERDKEIEELKKKNTSLGYDEKIIRDLLEREFKEFKGYNLPALVVQVFEMFKDLKEKNANLTKTINELTEVKMAREKSEERLRKQSEDFEKVQKMNQVVYDILGEYSTQTGLLLRSQEVVKKLKTALNDKRIVFFDNSFENNYINFDHWIKKIRHEAEKSGLGKNYRHFPPFVDKLEKLAESNETQKKELEKTKADLQKELSWWDKWIEDDKEFEGKKIGKGFILNQLNYTIMVKDETKNKSNDYFTIKTNYQYWFYPKNVIKTIHDYYLSR